MRTRFAMAVLSVGLIMATAAWPQSAPSPGGGAPGSPPHS